MRQIRFRAWEKVNGRWAEWDEIGITKEFEIQQFTGLFDKNGKEIYEGDILDSQSGNKFKVIFEHGCFMKQHIDDDQPAGYLYEVADSFWIVGNIYENPELIK